MQAKCLAQGHGATHRDSRDLYARPLKIQGRMPLSPGNEGLHVYGVYNLAV